MIDYHNNNILASSGIVRNHVCSLGANFSKFVDQTSGRARWRASDFLLAQEVAGPETSNLVELRNF